MASIIDPNFTADQAQLDRRMAMANALRMKSLQGYTPQNTEMVGGWAVPQSGWGNVIKALSDTLAPAYMANSMDKETDVSRKKMNDEHLSRLVQMLNGNTQVAPQQTAPQGQVSPQIDSSVASQSVQPQTLQQTPQGVPQAAVQGQQIAPQGMQQQNQFNPSNLLRGNAVAELGGNNAGSAYWKQFEPSEEQKKAQWLGLDPQQLAQLEMAKRRKEGIIEYQPGTTAQDLVTGQQRFQPKVGEGITVNNGTASPIPGYADANANIQGAQTNATEGAKATWNPTTVNLPSGPVLTTQSNVVNNARNGGIALQTPQQAKIGNAATDAQLKLAQTVDTSNNILKQIDEMIGSENGKIPQHPGFKQAVGSPLIPMRYVPGTAAADFKAREEQLTGGAFLQAYNDLRGGGQITEVEGKKAQDSLNRAKAALNQEDYKSALRDFQGVIRTGMERAKKQASGDFSPTTQPEQQGRVVDFGSLK